MEITLDWIYGFYTGVCVAGLAFTVYETSRPRPVHDKRTTLLEWWVNKVGDRLVLKLLARRESGEGDFITVDFGPHTAENIGEALLKGAELFGGGSDGPQDDRGEA